MKNSQNTALLWLPRPARLVPKHRSHPQAQLSAPTQLDFCVTCLEAAPHTSWCVVGDDRTCFAHYQEAEQRPADTSDSQYRLTLKPVSSEPRTRRVAARALGTSFLLTPRQSPPRAVTPGRWAASRPRLLARSVWFALKEQMGGSFISSLSNT